MVLMSVPPLGIDWVGKGGQASCQHPASQRIVLTKDTELDSQDCQVEERAPAIGRADDTHEVKEVSRIETCAPDEDTDYEDLNLVESVTGLVGLKTALASIFISDGALPANFRRGYIVDLDQHWISVHAVFRKEKSGNSLSLIVFDTLEVNYQHYHRVGLLRSTEHAMTVDGDQAEGVDVAQLCQMLGIKYEISFLAPICDMRRLTLEEEEDIRLEKQTTGRATTIYYDRRGNPFRKIIVQPILQAERDGTCKSRSLAALGWLLRLDEHALSWYVASARQPFLVELRRLRGTRGQIKFGEESESDAESNDDGDDIFGTLMSSGRRDKFGRDVHLKVCHADTMSYNCKLEAGCSATTQRRCLPDCEASPRLALLPSDSKEVSLRRQRGLELSRIREVLLHTQELTTTRPAALSPTSSEPKDDATALTTPPGADPDCDSLPYPESVQGWRGIEDHEARWQFLEETCFFGHNLGFKKIKKLYPREELVPKDCQISTANFGTTQYLRKYMVKNDGTNYITHEADPVFHEPLENILGFLSHKEEETQIVPIYVLPFPNAFIALSLNDYVKDDMDFVIQLEGDPVVHRRQRVSDFSIPLGNSFLNNPSSYNKARSSVSLPVKL